MHKYKKPLRVNKQEPNKTNNQKGPPLQFNPTWRQQANCKGKTSEMYKENPGRIPKEIIKICQECSVKEECLTDAILSNETQGIRAGRTYEWRRLERRTLLKQISIHGKVLPIKL